jgi:hypothetical protein
VTRELADPAQFIDGCAGSALQRLGPGGMDGNRLARHERGVQDLGEQGVAEPAHLSTMCHADPVLRGFDQRYGHHLGVDAACRGHLDQIDHRRRATADRQ